MAKIHVQGLTASQEIDLLIYSSTHQSVAAVPRSSLLYLVTRTGLSNQVHQSPLEFIIRSLDRAVRLAVLAGPPAQRTEAEPGSPRQPQDGHGPRPARPELRLLTTGCHSCSTEAQRRIRLLLGRFAASGEGVAIAGARAICCRAVEAGSETIHGFHCSPLFSLGVAAHLDLLQTDGRSWALSPAALRTGSWGVRRVHCHLQKAKALFPPLC